MATVNKNQQLIFDGQWLPSKSFNRRNLFRSTFKNCFLEDSRFKSATLSGSVFINCDMKNVKFNKADLIRATFIECDLRNADFRKASVREINLIDCYMNDVLGLDDLPMRCPETGEFTAWKKCYVNEGDEYRSVLVTDTVSEISNSLNSVNEELTFIANITMSPAWYNILATVGITKDIPNNWLKMHGMAMRRRIRRR